VTLVEEIKTPFGTINIFHNPVTGVTIYDVGGCHQSSADDEGTSLASYIHAIFSLLTQAKAKNILIIGCGGGTLGTMLVRAQRKTTIVDIDPMSFTIARNYFALHPSVVCHVADGETFLRDETQTYDAIVLDAFHGENIPSHLQTPQFFSLVQKRLTPAGAVFSNIRVKHDFDKGPDLVAKSMRTVWTDVRVLDAEGVCGRNAIVMAGQVSKLREPKLLVRPKTDSQVISFELERLRFRAWSVSRWAFGE
jgi:spermidine synthase